MRKIGRTIAIVALAIVAFGAGYWFRGSQSPSRGEMEGYALANVLENVGYAAFLAKNNVSQVRDLIDINLNTHLARIVQYQGSLQDDQFIASKVRTLNAAARLWDERPPFSAQQQSAANAHWFSEWKETTAQNMKLLEWAKSQCASTPSLKCATGPIGR